MFGFFGRGILLDDESASLISDLVRIKTFTNMAYLIRNCSSKFEVRVAINEIGIHLE